MFDTEKAKEMASQPLTIYIWRIDVYDPINRYRWCTAFKWGDTPIKSQTLFDSFDKAIGDAIRVTVRDGYLDLLHPYTIVMGVEPD